jgi:hypothetical protein
MRIFDFIIQSLLLLAALVSVSLGKEGLVWLAFMQFFMGIWQLISAIANSFYRTTAFRKKMMLIYWLSVLGYFLVMGGIALFDQEAILATWFFMAWGIAIFYYIYTIRLAFIKEDEKHSFLDIVND